MKFNVNPTGTQGKGIIFSASTCPCVDAVNCAITIPIAAPADYEGLEVNGVFTAPAAALTTNQEVIDAVIVALNAAGAYDYNADSITYDGTTLAINEAMELIPVFTISSVKTDPTQLCKVVTYCTYQGAGAAGTETVLVDGVAATEATYDAGELLWTIIAPQGATVTINTVNAVLCFCNIKRYEA